MIIRKIFCPVAAILLFFSMANFDSVSAQPRFGIRGGANLDQDDLFLGAHMIQNIHGNWVFNPNFEYTFADPGSQFTINADFHYDFPSNSNMIFWVGSGLGISHYSFEDQDNTDLGLNLLTGVSFSRRPVIPYIQVKVSVFDDTQLLIGGGITF